MLVQVGKYSANNLYCPQKYILCSENISFCPQFYIIIPSMLLMPQIYFTCAPKIYIQAPKFFMLVCIYLCCPRKHFGVPGNFLVFPRKIIHCAKIFSNPRKHLVAPRNLLFFMRGFFGSFLFGNAGLP